MLGRLHLVTDTRPGRDPIPVVAAALDVGVPVVQVRVVRSHSDLHAYRLAERILGLCRAAQATCLINDRVHVALALCADGAHVGADDLPVSAARRLLGERATLGATAREPGTARAAVAAGATYLGVGPAYGTSTKEGLPEPIGPAGVAAVVQAVSGVPVIAIGGVTAVRVPELLAAGAYGVAVVDAISGASDPARAAMDLLAALERANG